MSGSKHTPGPWEAHQYGQEPDADWTIAKDPGMDDAAYVFSVAAVRFFPNGEGEANARLIAAAPQLLALVEQYASECGECNGTGVVQAFCDASGSGISHAYPGPDEPCPDCADIRGVIAAAGATP